MISTGNDIVALNTINIGRTNQFNFYSKIITPPEKALFDQLQSGPMPFENFIWLSWSVKEAAYKYLQRIAPGLVFSPSKIIMEQLHLPAQASIPQFDVAEIEGQGFNAMAVYHGKVSFNGDVLYFKSMVYQQLISSVVSYDDAFDNTYWGIKQIDNAEPAYQSKKVREFALEKLNALFLQDGLAIAKNIAGCPVILTGANQTNMPVSLAHHGCFIAYSFVALFK